MSLQDPISDMFTRIRNGQMAKKESVSMPTGKLKVAVAELLKAEGYIGDYHVSTDIVGELTITLRYYQNKPVIQMIRRVSKPGLRVYRAAADLTKVLGGLGIAIVSTSQGLMTDRKARAQGIGGEVLGYVS